MASRAFSSLARGAASAAGAVASLVNPFTVAGAAVAAVGAVSVGTALSLKKLGDAMEEEARRLSKYSGDLAVATSQTDLRRELAQMRRARQLGPQMANLERFRSRTEDALFNIGTEMRKTLFDILEVVQPLPEIGLKLLQVQPEIMKVFKDGFGLLVNVVQGDVRGVIESTEGIAEDLKKFFEKLFGGNEDDMKGGDPLLDKLLAMAPNEQPLVAGGF